MNISPVGSQSILSQLQNMQRQMNTLSMAANADKENNIQTNEPLVAKEYNDTNKTSAPNAADSVGEFQAMLKSAFENVNILQNESSTMQSRFDVGDRSVSLADVMLASQKSSISFEATLQTRNKLVEAYKSIMQMSI